MWSTIMYFYCDSDWSTFQIKQCKWWVVLGIWDLPFWRGVQSWFKAPAFCVPHQHFLTMLHWEKKGFAHLTYFFAVGLEDAVIICPIKYLYVSLTEPVHPVSGKHQISTSIYAPSIPGEQQIPGVQLYNKLFQTKQKNCTAKEWIQFFLEDKKFLSVYVHISDMFFSF